MITPLNIAGFWSGGVAPYTFSVFSGTLPVGLSLDPATGIISGTPTVVQAASPVVFRATDAAAQTTNSNSVNWTITSAGDPTAIALVNATQAWWDFEQNDGTNQFLDSKNSNHLTAYNNGATTTSAQSTASGVVGRGMQNENAETARTGLIPRSNTNLDLSNTDFSFGGWFKLPASTGLSARFLMGRMGDGTPSTLKAWLVQDGPTAGVNFAASTDGTVQIATANIAVSPTFWYFFVATFDRTNNLLRIRGKSLAPADFNFTVAFPSALYSAANDANFCIWDGYAADANPFTGDRCPINATADSCFYMNKALTDAEVTMLYNAGAGLSYAQLLTLAGM